MNASTRHPASWYVSQAKMIQVWKTRILNYGLHFTVESINTVERKAIHKNWRECSVDSHSHSLTGLPRPSLREKRKNEKDFLKNKAE